MTKKPKVTLVTSANMPELFTDESGLPDALAERGMDPQIAVWNDPTVDWDAAGVCVIRSVSDYATQRQDFINWANSVPRLLNHADVMEWNTDKHYMKDLEALGLPCIYVPLPIGNGEQRLNAKDHVEAGGAQLIDDKDFTADFVRSNVFPLLGSTRLAEMAAASQSLGRAGAARALADLALAQVKEDGHE